MTVPYYYNQRSYPSVPYPSPTAPAATVKSGGCGVCCGSMAVEAAAGVRLPPEVLAPYAMAIGARVSGGTEMRALLRGLGALVPGFRWWATGDFAALWDHLAAGGFAVCSTPGNRSGRVGLMSTAPHLFCAAMVRQGEAGLLDPNLYAGKFSSAGRAGRARVEGDVVWVSREELRAETAGRTHYLISVVHEEKEEDPMTDEAFDALMARWEARRGRREVSPWAREEHEKAVARGITDGSRPGAYATREETAAMILRAAEEKGE